MKNYNLMPQEKNNFCVCTCLQAIFNFEGGKISQKDISKKLTPAEKGFKIHDHSFKNFINAKGFYFEFYWHNETPFNEPELLLDDMKNYNSHGLVGIKDHCFLFYDFKYPELKLIDPNNKEVKIKNYEEMVKEMYNTEGFFAIIKRIN